MDRRARLAARNNAQWCDLVSRSHGIETVTGPECWVARTRTPEFYPDAVTIAAGVPVEALLPAIDDGPGCSIKDSAADLDLAAHGFDELFEASWLLRDAGPADTAAAGWSTVETASGLAEWAAAHGAVNTFTPELLAEPSVRFLELRDDNGVRAGAILNLTGTGDRSGNVVGISNCFAVGSGADDLWAGVTAFAAELFPGAPLVGYEHGTDLAPALDAGFVVTGPLRVWLRPDARAVQAASEL